MAKDLLDKTGLTYLATKFQEWCEGLFVKKDTEYKDVYSSDRGVKVSIGGTIGSPVISVETTVGEISENNSSVVSGDMVKAYVDANKGVNTVFKAQTSSSNAVNGLVPAPTSANTQKYLRGDGTWQTPVSVINNLSSTSTTGALSAAQGKILNEKFGIGVYDLGAFYNYPDGCLIELGELAVATMVTIHITGYAYYSHKPFNSMFVFYDWVNNGTKAREIINYGGINLGVPLGFMKVYHYNNKIYVWIKQTGDYQTLSFRLHSNRTDLTPTVTNSSVHTSGVTLLTEIEPESPLAASTESSDGLMESTDKKNLNTIKKWYDNIVGVDEDKVINKWDEIVSFLSGIPEGDTLDGLIEAVKTQVGDLKADIEDGTVKAKEATTLGHETIGSTTKPIYLTSGVATPCTYTLGTSVPSDAKFTDTTYGVATTERDGLMSKSWVSKMDRITVTPDGHTSIGEYGTPTKRVYVYGTGFYYTPDNNKVHTVLHTGNIDTKYTAKNIVSNSAGAIETAAAANGEVHINLVENGTWRSGINITGSGATLVTSDAYGNITITSDDTTYGLATTSHDGLMSSEQVKMVSNSVQKGDNIDLSNGKALLFGQATSETWEYENGAGIKMLQAVGSTPKNAPSAYSVGLLVSGYYGFILARKVGAQVESLQYRGTATNGWETVITDKNIESYTTSYAKKTDITEGNITAAKAATADSANAIGGKSVDDLVQGGGSIKHIKVVTALPQNPSNDTLYLIKQ